MITTKTGKAAAALSAAKAKKEDAASSSKPIWMTKESGSIPQEDSKIRWLKVKAEAWKNNILKAWFAWAGAAIAQASRASKNKLRRG